MDSSSSGAAGSVGDPDDEHPNPVGDAVVKGVRKVLNKFGPAGEKAAEHLPDEQR
ncbi:hypothetical protein [Actinoallomurus iriomotensis]|uniref:Uncharacterized protein n=1 Tax=Actinoallomurus iriomotensis TaxID=478107 RepID=A0A9W6S9U0_9ACTN|nr:hypothetical protein [Actinoallomurus iriomotensis]GLY88502.1 hypothetical protein Airi02_064310 [Actinoallomurus iriomotensis]